MALINCSECKQEVSEKATSCPKCGAPIVDVKTTEATGTNVNTIQETSKKLKAQTLIGIAIIVAGGLVSLLESSVGMIIVFIGIIWLVANRIRTWWHHK